MSASVALVAIAMDLYLCAHLVAFMCFVDKYASFMYKKGYLTRCKSSISEASIKSDGRKGWAMLLENYYTAFITFYPSVWYLVNKLLPVIDNLDFTFKPINTWISLCGIYICFDSIYYFIHRFVHETPVLYKSIHKRHHDLLPVDVFLTARAEIVENVLFSTPGLLLWSYLVLNLQTPNVWTILIPVVSILHDFSIVHSGYYDSFYLYIVNPLSFIVQYTVGSRGMASRHENHHNLFTKNYAPFLPWFDRIFGTGKEFDHTHWNITYASEQLKAK
jgi:sterol desaturase/sphingolipid hydroxylase (fatty acid hydroxylase superfamily)